jgi:hypothetical protein
MLLQTYKQPTLALVAAVIFLGLLGCGSDDSVDGPTSLSKAQYLKQGDQICKKRLKEKDATVKAALEESDIASGGEVSKQLEKEVADDIVASFQKITKELDELPVPAKDQAAAEDLIREIKAGLKAAEENPVAALQKDPFEKAAEAARAYGFTTCNL